MQCPSCSAALPSDARFCIECGAELPSPANTGATTALPRDSARAVVCRACGAASPEGAYYCVRCGRGLASGPVAAPAAPVSYPAPPRRRRMRRHGAARLSGAIMLVGLGLLMLLKLPIWPLMLVVVGLAAFVHLAVRGHAVTGIGVALWLFSVVFLFRVPRLIVPGMIALVVIAVIVRLGWERSRQP